MTEYERCNPEIIARSSSRRTRISKGSGRPYPEVNALVRRFDTMKKQVEQLSRMDEDQIKNMQKGGMPQMPQPKKEKEKARAKGL